MSHFLVEVLILVFQTISWISQCEVDYQFFFVDLPSLGSSDWVFKFIHYRACPYTTRIYTAGGRTQASM
ncbi:hypothetical protein FRX31_014943 [Thalictrum thalictroides]|uniref:Secreted protein n=1 Tax=Thalictrum thalictroides TaxID=46969 RepID=A0A7J6WEV6_THATH|nr:hypothetical protein FRX31_014943 [Thalictrum thalictroides]